MVVALVGKPASGKTYWRNALAAQLGWRSLDIADYGYAGTGRWSRLLTDIASDLPVIIESCASPLEYRNLLARVPSMVIEVTASTSVRRGRLAERMLTSSEQKEWLRMSRRPPRRPDARMKSDGPMADHPMALVPMIAARAAAKGRNAG